MAERLMGAAVDALFVLTVLGLAIPVAAHLPPRARTILIAWLEGRNVDILVGLTALPVAWLCFVRRVWPRGVALAWNVAGIAILANIVVHALLSAPTPFQALWTEPPTTIITTLPYIWLPGFLVPLALSLHVASLRTLRAGPAPLEETR